MSNRFRAFAVLVLSVLFVACGSSGPGAVASAQGGATIRGSVVDTALNPLSGVVITLDRAGKTETKTTSASDGTFRLAGVVAGAYRVRAELAGFTAFSRDLTVKAGATSLQLPIVLARPGEKRQDAKLEDKDAQANSRQSPVAPPPPAYMPPPPPPATSTVASGTATAQAGGSGGGGRGGVGQQGQGGGVGYRPEVYAPVYNPAPPYGETYTFINPNRFQSTTEHPLSTFGADVDTASYSNVRRFLSSGQLPPRETVRVEEMLNYFKFAYANPTDGAPIGVTTEVGDCPWEPTHKLVLIGARAKAPAEREIGGRNIVLLIDVSGSMAPVERLPLIKTALGMFVDTLRPDDTLSIVTYAGSSGVALYPTQARYRDVIQRAIANLNAGGSTNGGQGLILAYRVAREAFVPGGVNRVILATDGDFNVGIVSEHDLLHLIERERESGVFLSVFGVGSGNLKDRTMEMLADKGNGHYSYLDSLQEARRVLIREADSTLETVAKDVKFQVEFNPGAISAYKLIGYEDRALAARDFNNDRKDAGEMGAGHTVTVLYEVIPVGVARDDRDDADGRPAIDPLRYQPQGPADAVRPVAPVAPVRNGEWLQVKTRFKRPDRETSELITHVVRPGGRVQHLPFAAAVAEFGVLLRDQPRNATRWDALVRRVDTLPAPGPRSDRDGFQELVAIAAGLARIR